MPSERIAIQVRLKLGAAIAALREVRDLADARARFRAAVAQIEGRSLLPVVVLADTAGRSEIRELLDGVLRHGREERVIVRVTGC